MPETLRRSSPRPLAYKQHALSCSLRLQKPAYFAFRRGNMSGSLAQPRASGVHGAVGSILSVAGPLSGLAAAAAVAKGIITIPTALLALVLFGAAAVILRTLAEPAASGMPSAAQTLHLIRNRRAVYPKDFTGGQLQRPQIEAMLEAARWAPTHKKTEPWRFVVLGAEAKSQFEQLTIKLVKERAPADKVDAVVAKMERKAGKDWKSVSCYIALCVKRHPEQLPEWEETAALACAVQNMWLAATAVGVNGYWSSWQEPARTAPEMLEFLGLEPGDLCLGFFVAGTADPERAGSIKASRKPMDEVVQWRM